MIVRNESTLVVLGRGAATAAAVTERTGLTPTRAIEAGQQPERGAVRSYSIWQLRVEAPPEDESGLSSLRELLAIISPSGRELASLSIDYDARISWGGFSDSHQGGFILEPDIARGLADLELPLWGTTYAS